ncbi:MAG: rplF [Rickettsiales bacterium]|jgi:large subunit ribosomal protein L6|nr:rplF [Rickettsiales bacterium]
MSRVGKLPIEIPAGVQCEVKGREIRIKGTLGELKASYTSDVSVTVADGAVAVLPANDSKRSRAMWGTLRNLVNNMVKGVTQGFTNRIEINGVGYRASVSGKVLSLALGFSHDVKYVLPKDIEVKVDKNIIVISGVDKQKVGQVSAELMRLRPFEPYKGKGVFKEGKPGRRKEGKKK